MTIDHEPHQRRLRVDADGFAALVEAAERRLANVQVPVGDPSAAAAIGSAHVRALLSPVLRPSAQLDVTVSGTIDAVLHQLWLGAGAGTALAHSQGAMYEVLPFPSVLTPRTVARLVRLGPRPRLAPLTLLVDEVSDMLSDDAAVRTTAAQAVADAAPSAWPGWSDALRSGSWRLWRVEVRWPDGDGLGAAGIAVLDTPAGLTGVMAASDGTPHLVPTDPTSVWRALAALVPHVALATAQGADRNVTEPEEDDD